MDDELQHLLEMQSIYQKRLRVLEQQAAKFGAYAPAHVVVEIDDLQHQLAGLSEKLAPLAPELAVGRRLMASIHRSKGIVDAPRQLIGRDYLLVRIHAALDRGSRLLLYGLAGVGKTAIAAVVADQRISMGKGPVVWLQCGQASTDMVLDALWQRFASREKSRGILHLENLHDRVLTVRDLLAVAEIGLLVLDNVWNGAALYAALEAVPPGLPVLATAREKFALPEAIEVGELEPDAALNLLSFYAERDDLATDPEASRLCQELGYHAYALEIAGVTMRIDDYTPGELQLQIAKSPHNLPMPGNFAAEGRQSVKHLLDFSYQTLKEEERDLCQAFGALFAPGATADLLAEYVQQPLLHVDRMLKTLMRRSLVKHRRDQGHPFYALHALTYSYFGALHRQRGVGYQSTIAATVRYVRNHGEDLTLLALDQRNILGAAQRAQYDDVDAFYSIITHLALDGYFDDRGCSPEFLSLLDLVIEQMGQAKTPVGDTLHFLQGKRGNAYFHRGDFATAFDAYQAALTLAPNPTRRAMLLGSLGAVCSEWGRTDEATRYFEQGYELASAGPDEVALDHVLIQQSYAAQRRGDYETARRAASEAVELSRQGDNAQRQGYAQLNLAAAEFNAAVQKVVITLEAVLELAQQSNDRNLLAYAHQTLGYAYQAYEKYEEARTHFEKARQLFQELEYWPEATQLTNLLQRFGYLPQE